MNNQDMNPVMVDLLAMTKNMIMRIKQETKEV